MVDLKDISVAFVGPEHPGNIGFLARAMKNFGVSSLILVDGCTLTDETWIFSSHAKDVVQSATRTSWDGLMAMGFDFYVGTTCRAGGDDKLSRVAITPEGLADQLTSVDGTVCLLFGREGSGLLTEELEKCDLVVSIPSSPGYPTLNISHAAAIILYEIFKACRTPPVRKMRKANRKEKEVLLSEVERLIMSSPLPEHRKRNSYLVFKRLVNRAFITGRECHTLIGLVKTLASGPRRT